VTQQANGGFVYTPPANFAGPDTFTYIATDGVNNSAPATVTITVTDVAPVVDLNGPAAGIDFGPSTFTEGLGPVAIVDNLQLTVTDADSTQLSSATVQINNLTDVGSEVLAVTCPLVGPNCTTGILAANVVYAPATGTLTITGVDTLLNYQTLLRTLTYNHTSLNPTALPVRDITVTIHDRIIDNAPLAHTTVTVVAVNSPPTVTAPAHRQHQHQYGDHLCRHGQRRRPGFGHAGRAGHAHRDQRHGDVEYDGGLHQRDRQWHGVGGCHRPQGGAEHGA
jgi:hypothetical protein